MQAANDPSIKTVLGIIGGSGIEQLALSDTQWHDVDTPWGNPSDQIYGGYLNGCLVYFLPRHGRGHKIPPSEINYCANIAALKQLGVTDIISTSACGSLNKQLEPGCFVLVDQYVDRTTQRKNSFFSSGCVAHVSMAKPVSPHLLDIIEQSLQSLSIRYHRGGCYLAMEGPQFSSTAESKLYQSWGCDVIGMTNMPEARLAREAEMSYASIAMVTDYDSWNTEYGDADVVTIMQVHNNNIDIVKRLVTNIIETFPQQRAPCSNGADKALEFAIVTPVENRDTVLLKKLHTIASRVL